MTRPEVALVVYGREGGAAVAATPPHRIAEIPFDSERRRMVTVHARIGAVAGPGGFVAYAKGVPKRCSHAAPSPRSAVTRPGRAPGRWPRTGCGCWRSPWADLDVVPADLADAEQEMVLLGLVGMIDPPRQEAADAVAECRTAGIVPVMITGDHPDTAHAVAARVGVALTRPRRV